MTAEYKMGRGESKTFTHTVTSFAGDLVNLTNAEIYFDVYDLAGERVLSKRSTAAGGDADEIEILTQTGDTLGQFVLKLASSDTDIEQGARWAGCFVITAGDETETLKVAENAPFYVVGEEPPVFV